MTTIVRRWMWAAVRAARVPVAGGVLTLAAVFALGLVLSVLP